MAVNMAAVTAAATAAVTEGPAERSAARKDRSTVNPCPGASLKRRNHRTACAALVAASLLVALSSVAAERTLYKSVLPSGEVVYSDAPAPNAKRATAISVEPHPPNAQETKAAQQALASWRQQLLRDADKRAARVRQLDKLIDDASGELEGAELRREQGRVLQPGDRQGRRLSAGYSQRQQALDGATWKARQRLDDLVRQRAALQP